MSWKKNSTNGLRANLGLLAGTGFVIASLALGGLVLGCGKSKPVKSQDNWLDSLEQKKVEGPPPDIDVDDDDDDDDEEAKPPPKPATTVRPSSGRPMIQMGPSATIESTFGVSPGAILKLKAEGGAITLKIPEGALDTGYNLSFKLDKKGQVKKGGVLGSIAYLKLTPGDKLRARAVPTRGDKYELRVPLNGKASVNLAVGAVETDKEGVETGKPTWKVYAPDRIEEGFGEAYFMVPEIGPVMYIHATTAEATEPVPAAPGG